ncbi:DUF1501 domain-containing protein [soil metagenome]
MPSPSNHPVRFSRRAALRSLVGGSSLLLPGLLQGLLAAPGPLSARTAHLPARAKRVIFLYMTGGVSHIDTFDPKPALAGDDHFMGCIAPIQQDPATGIAISDLFPHVRSRAQDLCLIRSMQSAHFDHSEATLGLHTGSATFARPSFGSWISYGLGSENENLPSFVVIAPDLPYGGTQVYANDFLPAFHQGTRIVPGDTPVANLTPDPDTASSQRRELDFLARLNARHLQGREDDSALRARIKSFETAFQMQTSGPEAFDVSGEADHALDLYGLERGQNTGFGWQCLVARRLAERGVRVIELIHGGSGNRKASNWDSHGDMNEHKTLAQQVDRPIAGLLQDLRLRGMLDDTIVVFATEFGRTPAKEGKFGRGHHGKAFSMWLAGGGFKAGHVHGGTDERGAAITSGKVDVFDFHATLLHQLGIDHERLTYPHAGRDFRLTDVHGTVRHELLA